MRVYGMAGRASKAGIFRGFLSIHHLRGAWLPSGHAMNGSGSRVRGPGPRTVRPGRWQGHRLSCYRCARDKTNTRHPTHPPQQGTNGSGFGGQGAAEMLYFNALACIHGLSNIGGRLHSSTPEGGDGDGQAGAFLGKKRTYTVFGFDCS